MNSELVLVFSLIATILANIDNELILDYFYYKKAPSVVGFSCNNAKDDLSLARSFNKIGVKTSFRKLDNENRINRFAYSDYWKLGVFLDLRCYKKNSIVSVFSEASDYKMYDELHYWFIIGSSIENVMNVVEDTAFGLSTDFVIVVPSVDAQTFQLYDTYNVWKERGTMLNVTFLGSWSMGSRLNVTLNETKFKRRANLQGMIVRASFYKSQFKPPDLMLEDYLQDYESATKDGISKYGFIIIKHLSELFNFNLQIGLISNWEPGDVTGPMIRAVYDKEIDITGTAPTMNVKRTHLVKYIHQSWPFSPQPKNIKIKEVFEPLESKVWYLTAITFTMSVWVMASVFQYEHIGSIRKRYSDSALLNIGAVCQQGTDIKMNQISTRIAFYFILTFNFLIYTYYSASIVSTRLNDPIYKLNDSLSELSKTNIRLSSEWMVYFDFFIKRQDWETKTFYTKRWRHLPESDQFMEPDKAMRLVQEGGFAYHMHPDIGYPYINRFYDNREICELTEIHLAHPTYATFAVNYNSTLTEIMRTGFTKMSEVGLRRRQLLRWTARKPNCLKNVLSATSINIYEFAPHLLILLFGMSFAVVFCIVEKAWMEKNGHLLELLENVWAGKCYHRRKKDPFESSLI